MPDQISLTHLTLEDLQTLLQRAQKLATPPKEKTIFSVAGRGHYENPASDLLGFFFDPSGAHGFGPLFLEAFFECMDVDHADIGFGDVTVLREVKTSEGKFIDLVVQGSNWALIIENKIYHLQNNPFSSYEGYADKLKPKALYFAVLSPEGKSEAPKQWRPVSYKNYCRTLRKHFADTMFDHPHSKWMVFAREFVLHYENELYSPMMTKEQFLFVEQHLLQIEQVKSMSNEYTSQLMSDLQSSLREALPTLSDNLKVVDEGWAFRCVIKSGLEVAFQTPRHQVGNTGRKFRVIIYVSGLSPDQEKAADNILTGMARGVQDDTSYWTQIAPESSREAIKMLCELAQKLSAL